MGFTIQPALGAEFVNREKELKDILATLRDKNSCIGFALYGKRRVGKTSIFKETKRLLEKEKYLVPIYFSIWDLVEKNVIELAKELGTAIIDAYRPFLPLDYKAKELLHLPFNLLKKSITKLKLSVEVADSISFILSFNKDKKPDPAILIDEVFTLPEKLANATKKKCILIIDEFPDIADIKVNGKKVGESIIKKIRTIQEDFKKTSLNISGSTRKTMESAILSSTSAFYRQFVVKEIRSLAKDDTRILMNKNLIDRRLTKDGLEELYNFTIGIPFYVQFIGRLLNSYPVTSIGQDEVQRAIKEFLSQEGNLVFKEELDKLSDKERLIAITMATKDLSGFSDISQSLEKEITNLSRFLTYLEEKGVLEKQEKGTYVFTDPIFKEWLSQKYL